MTDEAHETVWRSHYSLCLAVCATCLSQLEQGPVVIPVFSLEGKDVKFRCNDVRTLTTHPLSV
jgi:hypothetical protein